MNEQLKKKLHFARLLLELNDSKESPIHRRLGRKNVETLKKIRKLQIVSNEERKEVNDMVQWLDNIYDGYITERWSELHKKLKNLEEKISQ